MKVLIWVKNFPVVSETFIRDHVVNLIDQGIDVLIYAEQELLFEEQAIAIEGYESYRLDKLTYNIYDRFKKNKFKRIYNILKTLCVTRNWNFFQFYLKSFNYFKFGRLALSGKLFFGTYELLNNSFDIIHAHFGPIGNNASVYKSIGLPLKLFVTFHGYDIRLGFKEGGHIYQSIFNNANKIIAISKYNKSALLGFGASKEKLIDLPNGVKQEFFQEKKNKLEALKFLSVSRLVEEKNIEKSIEAIAVLKKKYPTSQLEYTIVGDGHLKRKLIDFIEILGMNEIIKIVGYKSTDEVKQYMFDNDVLLLPSINEALPTVLLEAQASRMLIVACDVGSVKDIVFSGELVRKQEPFINGILRLLEKKESWNSMSIKGQNRIKENYNAKILINKLIAHYHNN